MEVVTLVLELLRLDMVFGTQTAASRALQLRQSYLCISRYIRSRKYLGHSTYPVTGAISTRCSSTSVKDTLQDSKSKLVENAAGSTLVKPQNISKHHARVLTSHVPELDTSQYKSLVNFERTCRTLHALYLSLLMF